MKASTSSALIAAFLMALAAISLAGCNSGPGECYLAGKVTSQGRPVTDCHVVFSAPDIGFSGSAPLDDDGNFQITGFVRPGDYRVHFAIPTPLPRMDEKPKPAARKSFKNVPAKYQQEQTTDLKVKVVPGKNEFNLDLKP